METGSHKFCESSVISGEDNTPNLGLQPWLTEVTTTMCSLFIPVTRERG
jgi:hypothetical protein